MELVLLTSMMKIFVITMKQSLLENVPFIRMELNVKQTIEQVILW